MSSKKTIAGCLLLPLACAAAGTDATRIGRSTGAKAPEFQELYDYEAAARPLADATFPYEVQLHRAHLIMLAERGIVSRNEAAAILRGLAQVDRQAATATTWPTRSTACSTGRDHPRARRPDRPAPHRRRQGATPRGHGDDRLHRSSKLT